MQLFKSTTPVQSYDPIASLEALQEITDICNSITLSTPAFEALMELPNLAQEFNTTSTASLSMLNFVTEQHYNTLGLTNVSVSQEGIFKDAWDGFMKFLIWLKDKVVNFGKRIIAWFKGDDLKILEKKHEGVMSDLDERIKRAFEPVSKHGSDTVPTENKFMGMVDVVSTTPTTDLRNSHTSPMSASPQSTVDIHRHQQSTGVHKPIVENKEALADLKDLGLTTKFMLAYVSRLSLYMVHIPALNDKLADLISKYTNWISHNHHNNQVDASERELGEKISKSLKGLHKSASVLSTMTEVLIESVGLVRKVQGFINTPATDIETGKRAKVLVSEIETLLPLLKEGRINERVKVVSDVFDTISAGIGSTNDYSKDSLNETLHLLDTAQGEFRGGTSLKVVLDKIKEVNSKITI